MVPSKCLLLAIPLALVGCGRPEPEPRVYQEVVFSAPAPSAPAEAKPHGHPPPPMDASQLPTSAMPPPTSLAWTLPEGWTERPASGMRTATFNIADPDAGEGKVAECTIIVLGGVSGTRSDNIVRWLGQLNRTVEAEALGAFIAAMPRIETPIGPADIADLGLLMPDAQPGDLSTLAAFVAMDGRTVFVKLTGSHVLLQRERDRFAALCQSLKAAPVSAPTPPPAY